MFIRMKEKLSRHQFHDTLVIVNKVPNGTKAFPGMKKREKRKEEERKYIKIKEKNNS